MLDLATYDLLVAETSAYRKEIGDVCRASVIKNMRSFPLRANEVSMNESLDLSAIAKVDPDGTIWVSGKIVPVLKSGWETVGIYARLKIESSETASAVAERLVREFRKLCEDRATD